MKFHISINDHKIREACQIVVFHYKDTDFLRMVQDEAYYNHTNLSPKEVAIEISQSKDIMIAVRGYKPMWRWSKAVAYADYKSQTIYFNEYRDMPLADRVETIFHEFLHIVGYQHNGNRVTEYNLRSVPYAVSNLFVKYLKNKSII